jgi:predicted GNAT family acetyltransferase
VIDSPELIRIHLELECVGIDADEQLYRIPCDNPDDLPRFYIARHDGGYSRYCGQGLAADIREQLLALPPEDALRDTETVLKILAQDAPCEDMHIGKSYVFPAMSPELYRDAVRLNESHRALIEQFNPNMKPNDKAVYAIIADGQIASTCASSRENEYAGEAWVQTLPPFRGRGYARQVTAAWAHDLQRQGKTPFYSHKLSNLASQSVAQGLALIRCIDDAAYT